VEFIRHLETTLEESEESVLPFSVILAAREELLDADDKQERPKDIKNPAKARDQCGS